MYFLTCVYVHKICEKFGSCKKSFLWFGQKVNKKIDRGDAYGHDADESGLDLCPWPQDDAISQKDIQYSNQI